MYLKFQRIKESSLIINVRLIWRIVARVLTSVLSLKAYRQISKKRCSEAVVRRCSTKKVFKSHRKHLRQWLVFNKVANFIKKESLAPVFSCKFCEISKNTLFCKTPPVAASGYFGEYFHMIKHANFQLYRAHPDRVI